MTPCWEWPGTIDAYGYGDRGRKKADEDGFSRKAHRAMYQMFVGPIPEGALVRHTCDNPPCVNIDHLLIGTHSDNMQDALDRGRIRVGEDTPTAKLTNEQADEIKRRRESGERGSDLAREFGVTPSTVCDIYKGRTRASPYSCANRRLNR